MTSKPFILVSGLVLVTVFSASPLRAQDSPGSQIPLESFFNPFGRPGNLERLIAELESYYTTPTPGVHLLKSGVRVLADYGAAYEMGFSSANVLLANLENRLEDIRIGAPGFSSALGGQNWLSKHPNLVPVPASYSF